MEGNNVIAFTIDEQLVRNRIATNSFYRGERMKNGERENAAIMQSGEDNADIINDELFFAENTVVGLISRNLGLCTIEKNEDKCIFNVKAISNFPSNLINNVEGVIVNFLCDKVLEGWLLISMPNEVQNLRDRFIRSQEELVRLLLERSKPIRTT